MLDLYSPQPLLVSPAASRVLPDGASLLKRGQNRASAQSMNRPLARILATDPPLLIQSSPHCLQFALHGPLATCRETLWAPEQELSGVQVRAQFAGREWSPRCQFGLQPLAHPWSEPHAWHQSMAFVSCSGPKCSTSVSELFPRSKLKIFFSRKWLLKLSVQNSLSISRNLAFHLSPKFVGVL